jgi:hypothetical protein
MTLTTEVFTLPFLLLTVALVGGLRVGARVELLPPSLFSLVLAILAIAALTRSGALRPERLMHASRTSLANVNGLAILLALVGATAQALALVTPEWGLPRITVSLFLFVLLLNTHAAAPDRTRVLRSFAVIFGATFLLKFVVLAALSDPVQGRLGRALQILLEGVTLGTLVQPVYRDATGYVALAALVMYLAALALLPHGPPPSTGSALVSTGGSRTAPTTIT